MGESGAGKTVTTHNLIQFLCKNCPHEKRIAEQAAAVMKVLNIFGNSETPDNLDSSRFVKFLQV